MKTIKQIKIRISDSTLQKFKIFCLKRKQDMQDVLGEMIEMVLSPKKK